MPRKPYTTSLLEERLKKNPSPEKKLELEFAAILFGTGISHGEALRIAETLCVRVGASALAERMHRISNEYLLVSEKKDG
jgi:hypothetical protein